MFSGDSVDFKVVVDGLFGFNGVIHRCCKVCQGCFWECIRGVVSRVFHRIF